jgi:hypothetical protein
MQASWHLINPNLDEDEFSQEHIHFIDREITQCHPSDYIEDLVNKRDDLGSNPKILTVQKLKVVEIVSTEIMNVSPRSQPPMQQTVSFIPDFCQGDFCPSVFHPPKG